MTVGGSNHSHATQDLQDAIAAGDYPEWTLFIQVRGTVCSLCSAGDPLASGCLVAIASALAAVYRC